MFVCIGRWWSLSLSVPRGNGIDSWFFITTAKHVRLAMNKEWSKIEAGWYINRKIDCAVLKLRNKKWEAIGPGDNDPLVGVYNSLHEAISACESMQSFVVIL